MRFLPRTIGTCDECGTDRGTRTTDGMFDYWTCRNGHRLGDVSLGPEP